MRHLSVQPVVVPTIALALTLTLSACAEFSFELEAMQRRHTEVLDAVGEQPLATRSGNAPDVYRLVYSGGLLCCYEDGNPLPDFVQLTLLPSGAADGVAVALSWDGMRYRRERSWRVRVPAEIMTKLRADLTGWFWEAPEVKFIVYDPMMLDGSSYIIEAAEGAKRHRVLRWDPDADAHVTTSGELFLEIARPVHDPLGE